MQTIHLNGRDYTIRCTAATLITFQRISGHNPLTLTEDALKAIPAEERMLFDYIYGWAMLSPEDQQTVQDIEALMCGLESIEDTAKFREAVAAELMRFMGVKPGDSDTTDRHDLPETEDGEQTEKKA